MIISVDMAFVCLPTKITSLWQSSYFAASFLKIAALAKPPNRFARQYFSFSGFRK
jgi:hypothetical protein